MFDFWMDLPAWLRIIVALIVAAIGGVICWFISFRLGVLPLCLGIAMLFFGGKSDSEKKGYHF